jgi:ssDNA-binding Zn-finger/Zn-ribbon topoisomerase 1
MSHKHREKKRKAANQRENDLLAKLNDGKPICPHCTSRETISQVRSDTSRFWHCMNCKFDWEVRNA